MTAPDEETFARLCGAVVRDIREAADLSQVEFSERVGIGQPTISRIERGLRVPSLYDFLRICDVMGADFDDKMASVRWW